MDKFKRLIWATKVQSLNGNIEMNLRRAQEKSFLKATMSTSAENHLDG